MMTEIPSIAAQSQATTASIDNIVTVVTGALYQTVTLRTLGVAAAVTVIDVARLEPIKSVRVGRYPWGVVVKP